MGGFKLKVRLGTHTKDEVVDLLRGSFVIREVGCVEMARNTRAHSALETRSLDPKDLLSAMDRYGASETMGKRGVGCLIRASERLEVDAKRVRRGEL